jgi:putative ABC transport system permease protein
VKLLELIQEAAGNLMLHKTRSLLAVLGIVFGVASVICMLSISEVARQDVIQRLERLGVGNVIVDSIKPQQIRNREREKNDQSYIASYGIKRKDLELIENSLPEVSAIVPMRIMLKDVFANQRTADISVVATTPNYSEVLGHAVREGRFLTPVDEAAFRPTCVLGADAARELFPLKSPIGEVVQIGDIYFDVVGVMSAKGPTGSGVFFANPDNSAFIPFQTAFARFGLLQIRRGEGSSEATQLEVNRAVLQLEDPKLLRPVAAAAIALLKNQHHQDDVSVTIPHSLIKEQKQSERIFRWVMSSLTAIALLVGGIGIMNIMLANLAERRPEIGLRRALGATQSNIVSLFLSESTLLCTVGGVLGVLVGLGLANIVGRLAQWTIVYHPWSVVLGIVVSVCVGLIFGTLPSLRAAKLDPVVALRAE